MKRNTDREQEILESCLGGPSGDTVKELLAMAVRLRVLRQKVEDANRRSEREGLGSAFNASAVDAFLIEHSNGCKVSLAYFREDGLHIMIENAAPASASCAVAGLHAEIATKKLAGEMADGRPSVLCVQVRDTDRPRPATPKEIVHMAIEQGSDGIMCDEMPNMVEFGDGGPIAQAS